MKWYDWTLAVVIALAAGALVASCIPKPAECSAFGCVPVPCFRNGGGCVDGCTCQWIDGIRGVCG